MSLYRAVVHAGLDFPRRGEDGDLLVITETDVTGNRVDAQATGRKRPARKRNRVDPSTSARATSSSTTRTASAGSSG